MSHETLKDSIKQAYYQYSLPEDRMEQLLSLQTMQEEGRGSQEGYPIKRKWLMPIVACACLLVAWLFIAPQLEGRALLESIADEVAMNHIKLKPLEVKGHNLHEVGAFFSRLNFHPIESSAFQVPSSQLIGGRYCSIKGEIASQLRYKNQQGGTVTLYQALLSAGLFKKIPNIDIGEPPKKLVSRGLMIKIWSEKGLVMASVNEP